MKDRVGIIVHCPWMPRVSAMVGVIMTLDAANDHMIPALVAALAALRTEATTTR